MSIEIAPEQRWALCNDVIAKVAVELKALGYVPKITPPGADRWNHINSLSVVLENEDDSQPRLEVSLEKESWRHRYAKTPEQRLYVKVGGWDGSKIFKSKKEGGLDFKAIAAEYDSWIKNRRVREAHNRTCKQLIEEKNAVVQALEKDYTWDYSVSVSAGDSSDDNYKLSLNLNQKQLTEALALLRSNGLLAKQKKDDE